MAGNQGAEKGGGTMTVEARLKQTLEVFGDPVENGVYLGKANRYYVFNVSTLGADFADDAPQHERYLIQVHLFAPLTFNFVKRRVATKKALTAAGFLWPECTDASDSNGRHLVFETEYAEGCDPDGDNDN